MKQRTLQSSDVRRLATLFVVAVSFTLFIANGAWAGPLFQSPVSPVVEEAAPVEVEPYVAPAEPVEEGDFPAEEDIQPEPLPEEPAPIESGPVEEPVFEPDSDFGTPVIPDEPATNDPAAAQPGAVEPRPVRLERDDVNEDSGSSNFILDQAELIDTVVVSTAYVWLCCGIGLFLLIPLVFLFLQIRGRTKIVREEIY